MRSGYFLLMSSEFRLNTPTVPSSSLCTYTTVHSTWLQFHRRERTHLGTFAIVLVLARELLVLETIEHLADGFCGFRQHGLQRDARSQLTCFPQLLDARVEERRNHKVIGGQFAILRVNFPQRRHSNEPSYLYTDLMIFEPSSKRAVIFSLFHRLFADKAQYPGSNEYDLHTPRSCSAKTVAWASATKTVLSAFPIRSFPSKLRMMYLASTP